MTDDPRPPIPAFAASSGYQKTQLTGTALLKESLKNLVVDNPILNESTRAVRKLFRPGKAAPLIAIGVFVLVYIWVNLESLIGRADVSLPFSYVELVLLTLIIPGSIYSSISGEREHATWDALIMTRLTAGQIIFGKLIWRLRISLIIEALCLVTICISRIIPSATSTSNINVIVSQLFLLSWSILLSAFGLWISAVTKRSITSLAVIVLVVLGYLAALPTLYTMFANAAGGSQSLETDPFYSCMLTFNPFVMLTTILNSYGGYKSLWDSGNSGWLQIVVYFGLSILMTIATYSRLRVLGLPLRGKLNVKKGTKAC